MEFALCIDIYLINIPWRLISL